MPRILVTCFEPFDDWDENSSWLAMVELTKELPTAADLTTRRYPVDFVAAKSALRRDLQANYDLAIHLGQSSGAPDIRLEMFAVNVAKDQGTESVLVTDGPAGHRSDLPLDAWARGLRQQGVPARVSYHAGSYLCNALLYWSLHFAKEIPLRTQATFVHLPLAPSQAANVDRPTPSMSSSQCAEALRWIITTAATVALA